MHVVATSIPLIAMPASNSANTAQLIALPRTNPVGLHYLTMTCIMHLG